MKKEDLLITIGKNIRRIREKMGISQAELAARCNYEKSNMSRIESGKTNLTLGTLLNIAQSLGISVVSLMEEN